jgi:segregation and condensation protein A
MIAATGSLETSNIEIHGSSAPELGIALLIDLAKRGEINPWDVQVIDVIDRFLSQLVPVQDADQVERQAALSQSGQAFLYASMLVLLKADSLARSDEEVEEVEFIEDGDLLAGDGDGTQNTPLKLERQLRRRAVAQPPSKRRVTLQELIEQLQLMAKAMEERPRRSRPKQRTSSKSKAQAARTIAGLAHQENLTEIAGALDQFFQKNWPQISQEQDWLDIDQLLERFQPDPSQNGHNGNGSILKVNDRVGVFWALLLLSAQSKVELAQEEFYQDLKIRALPAPAQPLVP